MFIPKRKYPQYSQPILFASKEEIYPLPYSHKDFESITGLKYLSQNAFENKNTYQTVKDTIAKIVKKGKVSQRAKWLGARYADEIRMGYINDVMIQWVDKNIGYGLFARKDFKSGEYIGEYCGMIKGFNIFSSNINEYCFRYPIYGFRFTLYAIDSKMQCNETSFINHSNNSNCESIVTLLDGLFHLCIRTVQDVPEGVQLTYDYGKDYWEKFPPRKLILH